MSCEDMHHDGSRTGSDDLNYYLKLWLKKAKETSNRQQTSKLNQELILEKIVIQTGNNYTEIIINGNLNIHNIDLLEHQFADVISKSGSIKTLGINCEKMESIDSSGLGMLISLAKQAEKNSISFYLCGLSKKVSALFDISNLDRYFNIISVDEFKEIVHQ